MVVVPGDEFPVGVVACEIRGVSAGDGAWSFDVSGFAAGLDLDVVCGEGACFGGEDDEDVEVVVAADGEFGVVGEDFAVEVEGDVVFV